jgi:hypothetical protein
MQNEQLQMSERYWRLLHGYDHPVSVLDHPVPVLRTETVPPNVGGTFVPRCSSMRSPQPDIFPLLHSVGTSRRSRRDGGGHEQTYMSSNPPTLSTRCVTTIDHPVSVLRTETVPPKFRRDICTSMFVHALAADRHFSPPAFRGELHGSTPGTGL